MTVNGQTPDAPAATGSGVADIAFLSRYIRDFSFENLAAPVLPGAGEPALDISVDLDCNRNKHNDDLYELLLSVNVSARRADAIAFIVELSYAGLFQLGMTDAAARQRFIFVEAPRLLFPFAERIIADVTRDGGLPPLILTPPDFDALYREREAGNERPMAAAGPVPA